MRPHAGNSHYFREAKIMAIAGMQVEEALKNETGFQRARPLAGSAEGRSPFAQLRRKGNKD